MKKSAVRISSIALAIVALFAAAVYAQTTPPAGSPVARHGHLRVEGHRIVDKDGNPVQLRGMSLFWSISRGSRSFYNADAVRHIASDWQATVVRAAMGVNRNWAGDEQGFLTGDPTNRDRVITVVDAAIAAGIYVIIDWHAYQAEYQQAEAVAFFEDMATRYGKEPNIIYEIYNEPICDRPQDPVQPASNWNVSAQCAAGVSDAQFWSTKLKPYMQAVTNAIRARGSDNVIILGTPRWCQRPDVAAADPINGINLAYSLHFYANSPDHRDRLRENAARAMLQSGQAIFASEFGTVNADGGGAHNAAETDIWMDFMDQFHIGWANWALHASSQTSAALTSGQANQPSGWNLSPSGTYIRNRLRTPRKATPTFFTVKVNTSGQGEVAVDPQKLLFKSGETVSLVALANTGGGWSFAGWSGAGLTGNNMITTLTITGDVDVTARFTHPTISVQYKDGTPGITRWSVKQAGGGLTVVGPSGSSADVALYDVRGKIVRKFSVSGGTATAINNAKIPAGNYFVVVRDRATGRETYKSRVTMVN